MQKSVKKFIIIFNYVDPLFLYIPLVYYLSKLYQWSNGDTISVWQTLWNKTQFIFGDYKYKSNSIMWYEHEEWIKNQLCNDYLFIGDDPFNYCVVLFNLYANLFYWLFGLSLVAMEILNQPKDFHKYKIQQDRNTLSDKSKMTKVSGDFPFHSFLLGE